MLATLDLFVARVLLVLASLMCLVMPVLSRSLSGSAPDATLPFRTAPTPRSYVATRHLEVHNGRYSKDATLVARTTLSADGTFAYEVLEEGGSPMLLKRVLRPTLAREAEARRNGQARATTLSHDNYEFLPARTVGDEIHVGIVPRRKHEMLVKGILVLSSTRDLLRVEGQLTKRPSFWTRTVHIVRTYDRIAGTRVPVAIDSTAQVFMAGESFFRMTYTYAQINGTAVPDVSPTRAQ